MTEPARALPVLKWAGGKFWATKEFGEDIFAILKKTNGDYFEPFLGGGAMALFLGWPRMFLNDIEQDLVDVYDCVKEDFVALHALLQELDPLIGEDNYYAIRDEFPYEDNVYWRAARSIYLNKRCFNGLWRKNKSGKFNVPMGTWLNGPPAMPSREKLSAASRALQGATITCGDFERVIRAAGTGDVVYADPPYVGTADKYSPDGFSKEDHERLSVALKAAAWRGAHVFAHNSNTPEVLDWYSWAEVILMNERRSISRDGDARNPAPCVFIASCPTLDSEAP